MSETAAHDHDHDHDHDHELEVLEEDQTVPPRPEEQIADARRNSTEADTTELTDTP